MHAGMAEAKKGRDGMRGFLETCCFSTRCLRAGKKSSENFARSRVLKMLAALFNIPFYCFTSTYRTVVQTSGGGEEDALYSYSHHNNLNNAKYFISY